jgi:hypothetical protein
MSESFPNNLYRNASDRLTLELHNVPANSYRALCKLLQDHFRLRPRGSMVVGMDEAFQTLKRDGKIVSLGWDNWTGFTVVAEDRESEQLVREIGDYLVEWRA